MIFVLLCKLCVQQLNDSSQALTKLLQTFLMNILKLPAN